MINKKDKIIQKLKEEFKTYDPFVIADHLNIDVRYAPFIEEPKGMYVELNNKPYILINEELKFDPNRYYIMAHELFHCLDHSKNPAYYVVNNKNKSKLENEANKFAIILLTKLYIEENNELPSTVNDVAFKYGQSYSENIEKLY